MRPANVTQTAAPTWQSSASLSGGRRGRAGERGGGGGGAGGVGGGEGGRKRGKSVASIFICSREKRWKPQRDDTCGDPADL